MALTVLAIGASLCVSVFLNLVVEGHVRSLSLVLAVVVPATVAPILAALHVPVYFRLEAAEAQLRELATTDELTGLHNRRYIVESAAREISRVKRNPEVFSIALIDVDDFKLVNDRMGHAAGDLALQTVAAICARGCRGSDVVARYGGEEFLLLLPHTGVDGARLLSERLRAAIEGASVTSSRGSIRVTASFGITEYRGEATISEVIERADEALYAAKRAGKNRIVAA